jgi:adenosylcobyric acid synthase
VDRLRGALLVAGTTSDAGKSALVAGICRWLVRQGVSVAPFKAQNMSNNSVVTVDGGEIGRAQAMQAHACGLAPSVAFNPVLLKPGSDRSSQVVVLGRAQGTVSALSYRERKGALLEVVTATLADLRSRYDVVVCEGAGSPAEINLRATDIANMGLAQAADLPVVVVGDIDRGGVLAHLFGTVAVLSPADQARIAGFVVNKFRGDPALLAPGAGPAAGADRPPDARGGAVGGRAVARRRGLALRGHRRRARPAGAAVRRAVAAGGGGAVPTGSPTRRTRRRWRASRASRCAYVTEPSRVEGADLVVLPGSKADRRGPRVAAAAPGWPTAVVAHARWPGGPCSGSGGGYQMLGRLDRGPARGRD